MEIHQKKSGPDCHMVKSRIEQNSRKRILMSETEIVRQTPQSRIKRQKKKKLVQRSPGDCWQLKATMQCSKRDNCIFRHDVNRRAKPTQLNLSPISSTQQSEKNASRTRSPRGRNPSGRMARLPRKGYLKGTCTTPYCEVASSRMLVPQVQEWLQIWWKMLMFTSPSWRTA